MKTKRKIISIILSMALILSMAQTAFASGGAKTQSAPDYAAQLAELQTQLDRIMPRLPDKLPADYQDQFDALADDIGTYEAKVAAKADLEGQITAKESEIADIEGSKDSAYEAFAAYLENTELTYASVLDANTSKWIDKDSSLKYIIENGYTISIKAKILNKENAKDYTLLEAYTGDIQDLDAVLAYLTAIGESYYNGSLYANAFAAVTRPIFITDEFYTDEEWAEIKNSVKDHYQTYFTELVADVVRDLPPLGDATIDTSAALAQARTELEALQGQLETLEGEISDLADSIEAQLSAITAWLAPLVTYLDEHTIIAAIAGDPDTIDIKPNATKAFDYIVTAKNTLEPVSSLLKYTYSFSYDNTSGLLASASYNASSGKLTVKSANIDPASEDSISIALKAAPKNSGTLASGRIVVGSLISGTSAEWALDYQIKPAGQTQTNERWFVVAAPKTVTVTVWPKLSLTSAKGTYEFTVAADNYVNQQITDFAAAGGKPDYTYSYEFVDAASWSAGDERISIDEDTGVITIPRDVNSTPYNKWDKGGVNKPYRIKVTVTDDKGDTAVKTVSVYFRNYLDTEYAELLAEAGPLASELAAAKAALEAYPDGYVSSALLDKMATYSGIDATITELWNGGNPKNGNASFTKKQAIALIKNMILPMANQSLAEAKAALEELSSSSLIALNDAKAALDDFIADTNLTDLASVREYYDGIGEKLADIKAAYEIAALANQTEAGAVQDEAIAAAKDSIGASVDTLKDLSTALIIAKYGSYAANEYILPGFFTHFESARTNLDQATSIDSILSTIDSINGNESIISALLVLLNPPL